MTLQEQLSKVKQLATQTRDILAGVPMDPLAPVNGSMIADAVRLGQLQAQLVDAIGELPDVVLYTRDDVMQVVNDAAGLITDDEGLFGTEYSRTIRDHSMIDLVVNAVGTLLDNPDATLADVMEENWQADEEGESAEQMVRGWLE